jgi:hypothetical protein
MTFDTLKSGPIEATADLDHLITLLAFQVRSTRSEFGLTQEQQQEIYNRFSRLMVAYPEIHARVMEAVETGDLLLATARRHTAKVPRSCRVIG